ncbi:2Fe-2S iron-sulfur cluster binding domain-containing protein [Streptomyces finlayi]|uniref:2Fe-2S iron-sulfur cluster binding domain-containing protein n=1 Tax=Streptomyces finlayi TaxID=67296 RepID=A0A7G7BR42_9ACTN|nr:PDR/VanB family oxidoreductase [Streptomyces finlayi]QNE77807.1 2Fe-2S iron-sulfur cluster binding domain-containing protein [Streptomyces finlayi]
MAPPRLRTLVLVAGAAVLARRAVRRRIEASPLWPMPALEHPVSGYSERRSTTTRPLLITEREPVADGVVRLRLAGDDLPAWQPGAHLDLVLPSGLVRQYSLCGDPADRAAYTIAPRLVEDGRGGSREVHTQLHEGTRVRVRGPRNRFPLVEAPAYVFVAGGIGITPILPMLRAVAAAGAEWRLLYGGRTRASLPFLDEIAELGADGGRVTVVAEDEAGRPDAAAALAAAAPGTAVYVCGPEPLMDAVAAALPEGCALHLERFTAATGTDPSATAFDVELRRSGSTVRVEAGQSVLAAVREKLPHVSYSCEQGFCGTCRQRVLEGEIDHRDELLTDGERTDSMLLCVSRCRGDRLVLDL